MEKEKIEVNDKNEEKLENNSDNENKVLLKIWKVIRMFLLIITSPIWFPWKLLFVRKEGRKFNQVDTSTKVFRLVRSPFTKTLKFLVYLCVISGEFFLIYKVSNTFISYPIKKSAVKNYYLSNKEFSEYKDQLEESFNYIDDWNLSEKNKMYAFYDSKIVKSVFENSNQETVNSFLDRFNNEEDFRSDVQSLVGNSDKLITQAINEYKDKINSPSFQGVLDSMAGVGSFVIDFHLLLDIADTYLIDYIDSNEISKVNSDMVNYVFEVGILYNNGHTLEDAFNNACEKYNCNNFDIE